MQEKNTEFFSHIPLVRQPLNAQFDPEKTRQAEERKKAREEKRRIEINAEFGEELGPEFFNYTRAQHSWEQLNTSRQGLASKIVEILNSGSVEDQVRAVSALLKLTERSIEPDIRSF